MDIMELGAIGELVGGVAVIVTLVYLAIQVRGSKRSTDFLIEQGIAGQFNLVNMQIVQEKTVANMWRRGIESREDLDDDERIQFDLLFQSYMNIHHVIFDLGTKGQVNPRLVSATETEIAQYREFPGFRDAMAGRAFFFSPEFRALHGIEEPAAKPLGASLDEGEVS